MVFHLQFAAAFHAVSRGPERDLVTRVVVERVMGADDDGALPALAVLEGK